MIIINKRTDNESAYTLSLSEEHDPQFLVYATSKAEATNILAKHLIDNDYNDMFFDAFEVNLMASSRHLPMMDFAEAYGLYHCPKYHIFLPNLCIQDVLTGDV
jgi:hypothetical protein